MRLTVLASLRIGSQPLPLGLVLGVGALAYFGLTIISLSLVALHAPISPILPAAGLGVALVQRYGLRVSPAIAVGALAGNLLLGDYAGAVLMTIGASLEAIVGGLILRRLGTRGGDAPLLMPT